MASLLRLDRVTAGFGPTVIVEDVSFSIEQGDVLAVLGRNGVGKSSLMKTIAGHTRLHGGGITFNDRDIGALASYHRARGGIGYVPQTRDIFPSLTVEENLMIAAQPGQWDLDGVYELFPNLAQRRRNGGQEISGGEQQMLSIGRALMGNPRLLLLDEPMEGLAPVIVEKLFEVFELLRDTGKFAIIFVEQYVNLALNFAPRTIVLDRGRVIHDGRSADLAADPEKMAVYFGASGQGANAGREHH
ncbi:MAG: ABC transporter ATP-binding protein [Xanthobacteraceae bacterium]|nr:MAG: ABC transporter ATP-binding protein [Xanthobacteraceae bacterium]